MARGAYATQAYGQLRRTSLVQLVRRRKDVLLAACLTDQAGTYQAGLSGPSRAGLARTAPGRAGPVRGREYEDRWLGVMPCCAGLA